ncbi:hypothetical protein BDD12DRAFT_872597 [Trichophaea hybrida]|nr:hypothetical protein BDD12DRAFT_872597 [Trichophaea hybrida]
MSMPLGKPFGIIQKSPSENKWLYPSIGYRYNWCTYLQITGTVASILTAVFLSALILTTLVLGAELFTLLYNRLRYVLRTDADDIVSFSYDLYTVTGKEVVKGKGGQRDFHRFKMIRNDGQVDLEAVGARLASEVTWGISVLLI